MAGKGEAESGTSSQKGSRTARVRENGGVLRRKEQRHLQQRCSGRANRRGKQEHASGHKAGTGLRVGVHSAASLRNKVGVDGVDNGDGDVERDGDELVGK
eukprot:5429302-Pleurochrysis_carterae.AAC.2